MKNIEPDYYDLAEEGNEDAWLDAAYEDRFCCEPDYEPYYQADAPDFDYGED